MTETMQRDAVTRFVKQSPLVARVYSSHPCRVQSGGGKIVPDAVVDLGLAGPVIMFWQASAWTAKAPAGLKAQPLVNEKQDPSLGSAAYVNAAQNHMALLRRRALVNSLPEGESMFGVVAGDGVATDQNDTVSMTLLDISDMSVAPEVRLASWGTAAGGAGNLYTEQKFTSSGGQLVISASATAWSRTPGKMIGGILWLDRQPIAYFQVYANQANTHIGLVGGDRVIDMAAGEHTLRFIGDENSVVDTNDVWSLSVIEMHKPSFAKQLLNNAVCKTQSGGGVIADVRYDPLGGSQLICLSMSGYSATIDTPIKARVVVDGAPMGSVQMFANQKNMHMLLSGGDIAPGRMPQGQRDIAIIADEHLATDQNDRISLAVIEVFR